MTTQITRVWVDGEQFFSQTIPESEIYRREWVGLTKEELAEISEFHFHGALSGREFYEDIEAKLKEKNGG